MTDKKTTENKDFSLGKRKHWWQCDWSGNWMTENEPWFTLAIATILYILGMANPYDNSLYFHTIKDYITEFLATLAYCIILRLVFTKPIEKLINKTTVPILENIVSFNVAQGISIVIIMGIVGYIINTIMYG